MSGVKDSFLDLERHRTQLEDNINGLKKALNHWRSWDIEYEALKEEVEAVPAGDTDASQATELRRIQDAFEGELLDKDGVSEIFGQQRLKSISQIKNVLERRIDYVTKNIETLSKQLETLENKFAAATVISQPDATDEDGQPITDIVEELDEDDNVLSYRLMQPGDSLPHVQEALEKAGVKDLGTQDEQQRGELSGTQPAQKLKGADALSADPQDHLISETKQSAAPMKEVTFAEDTKTAPEAPPSPQLSRTAKRVTRIMEDAKAQENWTSETPVIPDDEDPEDAALRQEMLKYSMGEVGAVVAELQLEEMASDEEMEDFSYTDEEDGDEDQYGRYKGSVLTDDYRTRMLELEKNLGIKSRFSDVPAKAGEDGESSSDDEGIGRIVVKHEPTDSSSSAKLASASPTPLKSALKSAAPEKKGVRFSESLDIAPAEDLSKLERSEKKPKVDPVSEIIVERSGSTKPSEPAPARKPSRFKRSRDELPANSGIPKGPFDVSVPSRILDDSRDEMPTGPEGRTIADKLVERDTASKPARFDDIDDSMIQAEVADEHQRLRRKFIQREGGFLREDESVIQPLDESEGGREQVSRFKAARLSQQ